MPMQKNILGYLEHLDLSEGEAKLYLTLLETGPLIVRELARTVKINRTTAYMYLKQLEKKGLVMKMVKGSRTQVAANKPRESLPHLVEQKIQQNMNMREELPDIIKTLEEALPKMPSSDDAEVKHYKGKLGVKKIYEEVLKSKEIRSYVNIAEVLTVFPENAQLFDDANLSNPEMKMYEFVEDSPEARERIALSKKRGRYFYKILPRNKKVQSTDILIYDGKVSIINLKDRINGVILYNKDLYHNFKLLFDIMWEMIPDPPIR
jgi:sugar-specific transcriptional regulator TrmB